MKNYPNVTVCGCGSGGLAMAADVSLLGCRVNLYEFREQGKRIWEPQAG